jgi:hypothetical protein
MAYLLDESVLGTCAHGGSAKPIAGNPRVKLAGTPVLTVASQLVISGCPNNVSSSPVPCVLATFTSGATRVKVMGQPVLLDTSTPSNVPTGASTTLTEPQARVKGI